MLFLHLKTYTVSFFGHRYIDNFRLAEERLTEIIRDLLLTKEYVEFLVGRDGDFDQIVSSTIRRVKRDYGEHNSAHVCILPYMTAEFAHDGLSRLYRAVGQYGRSPSKVRAQPLMPTSPPSKQRILSLIRRLLTSRHTLTARSKLPRIGQTPPLQPLHSTMQFRPRLPLSSRALPISMPISQQLRLTLKHR